MDHSPSEPRRHTLTLKPKTPAASPEPKRKRSLAIPRLAKLGLPVFQRMAHEGVVLALAIGIREAIIARLDPPLRPEARGALSLLLRSAAYRRALGAEGARRYDLDGVDVGPVSEAHRLHAQTTKHGVWRRRKPYSCHRAVVP